MANCAIEIFQKIVVIWRNYFKMNFQLFIGCIKHLPLFRDLHNLCLKLCGNEMSRWGIKVLSAEDFHSRDQ